MYRDQNGKGLGIFPFENKNRSSRMNSTFSILQNEETEGPREKYNLPSAKDLLSELALKLR